MESPPRIAEDPPFMLQRIRDFIRRCEEALNAGEMPDMSGLDAQVSELCEGIQHLTATEYARLKPKIDSLSEELDALSRELEKQKREIEAQITSLSQQQKANTAYQKASDSVPLKPKEGE